MKKLNNKDFIERSIENYGHLYDYSLVNYINNRSKVKIICKEHGIFEQTPNGHLSGRGCEKCGKLNKRLNFEKFIKKSIKAHGYKYDYSEINLIDCKSKIKIICPDHGPFYQRPTNHYKNGCPKCSKFSNSNEFIEKSKNVHGDIYDYSMVNYVDNTTPVKIICKNHGEFFQKPRIHLKSNCPECSKDKFKLKEEDFIKKSIKTHGDKYDYSKIQIDGGKKIEIICKNHGSFFQSPDNHQRGRGCPFCNESKGEKEIGNILKENNIKYLPQHKFKDCKNKKELRFDFYLPENNICVEFDGIQHFEQILNWSLEKILKNDSIKNEYCRKNNIRLIRIRYDENINKRLNKEIMLNF